MDVVEFLLRLLRLVDSAERARDVIDDGADVVLLEAFELSSDHALVPPLEDLNWVSCAAEPELEGLLLHEGGLVVLWVSREALLEVVSVETVVGVREESLFVEFGLDALIFRVGLYVRLVVVAVALFLLAEVAEEVGVVVVPALGDALLQARLAALVVLRVEEFAVLETGYLAELSVQLHDGLLRLDERAVVHGVYRDALGGAVVAHELGLYLIEGLYVHAHLLRYVLRLL